MARDDAFEVEGVIVEVLANKTYRVELANGHRLQGFVTGKARNRTTRFALREKVKLQLSSYDLSEGRIIVATNS
jgi:translation initiation factor IF-1